MPIISFVTVTNGPALIAGSIFDRKKRIGVVDPIIAAILTARTIPKPTASPKRGEVWSIRPATNAIISPHKKPKMVPFAIPTTISLLTTDKILSFLISPVAKPRTITVDPWSPTFPDIPNMIE